MERDSLYMSTQYIISMESALNSCLIQTMDDIERRPALDSALSQNFRTTCNNYGYIMPYYELQCEQADRDQHKTDKIKKNYLSRSQNTLLQAVICPIVVSCLIILKESYKKPSVVNTQQYRLMCYEHSLNCYRKHKSRS